MKDLNRYIRKRLLIALVLTIMLPLGIFMTIFGAITHRFVMMGFGIAFIVLGFYAMPVAWVHYGGKRRLKVIYRLIEEENFYTVSTIASHLSLKERDVNSDINNLILYGFLKGYIFRNGVLEVNTNKKQSPNDSIKMPCPACGGKMNFNGVNFVCPYCGNVSAPEDKQ